MNGIILYNSTYGTTEQYATWLAEETGFPSIPLRTVTREQVRSAGCVIIGCPIHAGRPAAAGWIRKHRPLLADKPVHRLLMRIGQKIEKEPNAKASMLLDVDNVDRTGIAPIVARIRLFGPA